MKRLVIGFLAMAVSLALIAANVLCFGGHLDAGVGMASEIDNPSEPSPKGLSSAKLLSDDERKNFVPASAISDEIRDQVGRKGTPYENWRTAETLSITGSPPETQPASSESLPPQTPPEVPPEHPPEVLIARDALPADLESLRMAETISAEQASKLENVRLAENRDEEKTPIA